VNNIELKNGDCLELMKDIPDKSIDMILCDLPYGCGNTVHKWDRPLPFDKLWYFYNRIIKSDGIICLFSQQPFTSQLICSNIEQYRYSWIWKKESSTGFLNSNYCPLKITEGINIFSFGTVGSLSKNPIIYFPKGVKEVNVKKQNNPNSNWRKSKGYGGDNNQLNSDSKYIQLELHV